MALERYQREFLHLTVEWQNYKTEHKNCKMLRVIYRMKWNLRSNNSWKNTISLILNLPLFHRVKMRISVSSNSSYERKKLKLKKQKLRRKRQRRKKAFGVASWIYLDKTVKQMTYNVYTLLKRR